MSNSRSTLTVLIGAVFWLLAMPTAAVERPGGAQYQRNWTDTGLRVDLYSDSHAAGVYYLGPALPLAKMDFDLGSAFAGELFACNLKDADADANGTVDAAAGCTSLSALTGDLTGVTIETAKRFYVLDVNTAESGANVSRLTIHGSPLQVSSSGGGDTFSVSAYGAAADGTTNDVAAINRAIDAACDAGGGIVYFPPGVYGVGSTGANVFYSGIQVTCSDVILLGIPGASEIRPLFTGGGVMLAVCPAFTNTPAYGTNRDCSSAANLTNVRVEGLYFHDDDPTAHCTTYGAAAGTCASEESHGIFVMDCDNCTVTGNRFSGIGDEAIDFYGDYGTISDNFCTNTPSIRGGGGACILTNGIGNQIVNNTIQGILSDPNSDAGSCTTACDNFGKAIVVGTDNSTPSRDILVKGNTIRDADNYIGIMIASNAAVVDGISIVDNTIEMDNTATIGCNELAYTIANRRRCAVYIYGNSGTPTRDRILVQGNTSNAGFMSTDEGTLGSVAFIGNKLSGDEGNGISASGGPLSILDNTISSFQGSGIYLSGFEVDGRTDSVLIDGNILHANNDDDTADHVITHFGASGCGSDTVVPGGFTISNNVITASATAASVNGGVTVDDCTRATVRDNTMDFLAAGTANNIGIFGGSHIIGNKIRNTASYGIYTTYNNVTISNNQIELPGARAIFSNGGDLTAISGNMIVTANSPAIDASGDQPTCIGNTSVSTTTADRTIVCGETAPSGIGCTADGADAGGICDLNQVCNTTDAAC